MSALGSYPDVRHAETESTDALPEALSTLLGQGVELLLVNGGDGTLQHTLTELLAHDGHRPLPWVAPMRGGRTNMTALDLGAQRDPVRALGELVEAARGGRAAERVVPRPVLRVESKSGDVQYGMFFGAGVIHRAITLTHRLFPTGKSQGVLGAGLVTASLIARAVAGRVDEGVLTPDKVQVVLDGEMVRDAEFYLLIAASLQRLFLRMNPFWGTEAGGVRFTCVASNARHRAAAALPILRGRPRPFVQEGNGYTSRNADEVQLGFGCGYTIDGEIFPPAPDETVTIRADRRITFVRA